MAWAGLCNWGGLVQLFGKKKRKRVKKLGARINDLRVVDANFIEREEKKYSKDCCAWKKGENPLSIQAKADINSACVRGLLALSSWCKKGGTEIR